MKCSRTPLVQQMLAAAAILTAGGTASARPSYTHFEFGERYDKAARTVVPGFGLYSKTRVPPVNVVGWTKAPKTPKTVARAKKDLKRFGAPSKCGCEGASKSE